MGYEDLAYHHRKFNTMRSWSEAPEKHIYQATLYFLATASSLYGLTRRYTRGKSSFERDTRKVQYLKLSRQTLTIQQVT